MPSGDPWYIRALDQLGVNTTKLRWRLYQREKQAKQILETGVKPPAPSWWSYPNKICPRCRAINNRESKLCDSCGRRLPTMSGYRIRRLVLGAVPSEGPVVSMTFLALMFLFWGVQIVLDGPSGASIMSPSGGAIHVLGAFTPHYAVRGHEIWRFLSSGLVHGGLLHIGMNSYFLVQIGPLLETQLSRGRMLALITISQIASNLMTFFWYALVQGLWYVPLVGASGWLFGLLGYGIVFAHRAGLRPMRDSLIRSAVFMFVLGFMINASGSGISIGNTAHFGGLIGGLFFGVLPEGNRRSLFSERSWNAAAAVFLVMWIATIVLVARYVIVWWPKISAAAGN